MSLAWGCRHWFCAAFLQTECASSAGRGGGRGQDWSEHEKKWHSLRVLRLQWALIVRLVLRGELVVSN